MVPLFMVFVWVSACQLVPADSCKTHNDYDLRDLLPRAGDAGDWRPNGEPQTAAGEDLFVLINGGAEIYHEYGFEEVVLQSYSGGDDKTINLEIYKMDSQEAAYGIYTFKTGEEGEPLELGYEGWLESYYLNFWNGKYQVTVTGLGTDAATLDGIVLVGEAVDSRLEVESMRPQITTYLPDDNLRTNGMTYLRGNLGLFNQYLFDERDIFGLKEGVVGRYDDHTVFLFRYEDQDESMDRYDFAKIHLRDNGRYEDFVDLDARFEISDRRNNRIWIERYRNWIVIILGSSDLSADPLLRSLEKTLPQ
jgi:hypothetical protein